MDSSTGNKAAAKEKKKPFLGGFLAKLRKRHIIETLAAFIGGGWLLVEVVERLLVGHYKFPEESIDLTVVSVIGALLATLVWRWFGGTEKRPGNIKVEVLLVPLIILATLSIDLIILLEVSGISGKTFLITAIAVCLGIAWIILKSLQWAAAAPLSALGLVQKPAESPRSASAPSEKSIVVLPFTDLSPQKDQEYFCDGMTEEIIADLSHVHELLVISRSSAMTFKGSPKTVRDIAKDLNIRYVMEGSVRKAGNDLRITAQLIDASNDAHIWAEKYAGTLDDIFDIQEKVSRSIVDSLRLKLTPEENHRIKEKHISDIVAYEYYLQAKREVWSFNQENLDHALRLANQALGIVGENALLYATVALIYWQYHNAGFRPDEDILRQADIAAGKALVLDPELSQAHWAKGAIAYTRGELQTAARQYKRAAELEAGGEALAWLSLIHALAGRMPEARRYGNHAVGVDPLNILALCFRGLIEIYGGDFKCAVGWFQKGLEVMPSDPMTKGFCAVAHLYAGNREQSMALFDQLMNADAGLISSMGAMWKAALRADGQAVRKFMNELVAYARRDKEMSWSTADCLAMIGEIEEALDWLANSIEMGLINDRFFSEFDPFLAPLRGNQRFQALMERAREKERRFAV
jgi:non-specific serine/threonine protein kinase